MPFPQLSPKMIHHQLLMMLRGGCSFSNRSVTHHVNSLLSTKNQSAPEIGLFWVIGVLTSLLQGKQPPGVPASAGSPPRAWRTDVLLVGSSHLLGRGHLSTKELVTLSKYFCPSLPTEKWEHCRPAELHGPLDVPGHNTIQQTTSILLLTCIKGFSCSPCSFPSRSSVDLICLRFDESKAGPALCTRCLTHS